MSKTYPMIKVGFETWYIGPATPAAEQFLKGSVQADMSNWNEWLSIEAAPHVGDTGDIPDWVWEQLAEPCPHVDEEGHGPACLVCEGDEQYFPGWEPIEDGDPNECIHEPEGHTVIYSGERLICDVSCRKCGMSGSFIIDPNDINWS